MKLKAGDRIRTLIEWGCFRFKRGHLVEWQGDRPLVLLDGYVAPVLLFAHEVAPENDDAAPTEPHMTAGED